jgi:hypothetical protein
MIAMSLLLMVVFAAMAMGHPGQGSWLEQFHHQRWQRHQHRWRRRLKEPLIKTASSKESSLILLSETIMSGFCPDYAHSSPCKEVQAVSTTRFA